MVADGDLDVVSVATPSDLRRGPVRAALERGIHVLIEKPFTTHLPEARELAELACRSRAVSAVSFNWRYSPGNQVARQVVAEGTIGQITEVSLVARVRFTGQMDPETLPDWQMSTETGGGVLRQFGSHEFDRIHYLTGLEFASVSGRLIPVPSASMDTDGGYSILADLSGKASAHVAAGFMSGEHEWRAVLVGEDGTLRLTHDEVVLQRRSDDEPLPLPIPESMRVADGVDPLQHTWNRLIADFCSAIRGGDLAHVTVPDLPTARDGLRVQEFIAAAEMAHRERRWVDLSEVAT
jgi:predicted dehydrogenase